MFLCTDIPALGKQHVIWTWKVNLSKRPSVINMYFSSLIPESVVVVSQSLHPLEKADYDSIRIIEVAESILNITWAVKY